MSVTTPLVPTGTWTVDPTHSNVGFAVKHMVVSTFRGRFERFDAKLEDGRLNGTVDAASIEVRDPNLAGHLLSPDFFDAENHPQLSFTTTALDREGDRIVLTGDLTIKGHTHPVRAEGTITDVVEGLGGETFGISLEAVVDRREYGLNWNAPLPKGGFALANEVKLVVDLELNRQA